MCVRTRVCVHSVCARTRVSVCTQHVCVSIHMCVPVHVCVSVHSMCVCPYNSVCVSVHTSHSGIPGGPADVEVEIAEQMLLRALPGPVLPTPPQARPVMRGLVFVPLNLSPSMAGKCWFSCSIFIGKSPTHPGDGFTKDTQAQNWICLELGRGPPVSARCDSWGPSVGAVSP